MYFDLVDGRHVKHKRVLGVECEMQVRLYGYLQRQTWDAVGADSEWIPAPCPPESRTERLLRELM